MHDDRIGESTHVWLREAAREQRRRATPTEEQLWSALRARQLAGWRFRRQHPIGPYIVDFLCFEIRLVVEIDGAVHATQADYDAERDHYLNQRGYRVLRVSASAVESDLPGILRIIQTA
ncbi:MAG: endonuclease domain-containing protein [Chloroflexota bacterium]